MVRRILLLMGEVAIGAAPNMHMLNMFAKFVTPGIATATLALSTTWGVAEPVYLSCTITATFNFATGSTSRSTGTTNFAIKPQLDGTTIYIFPWACVDGTEKIIASETEYFFQCELRGNNIAFSKYAIIDRISGKYQEGFTLNGQDGLLHLGHCRKTERQF